jgi:hypothetical protein
MMKRLTLLLTAVIFLSTTTLSQAATTQVDSLIKKLVDKGILTEEEGEGLKSEVAYDEKTLREENVKKDTPEWVQNFKLSGDFRARVQTERRETGAGAAQGERVRGRMRTRLNVEAKANDKAKVVVGIATDGGTNAAGNNPRSANYTFSTNNTGTPFSKPWVVLNKAYGQYTPNERLTLTAGKMDNPIWEPMEFLWDSDITPEGAAIQYKKKLNDRVDWFALGSFFSLGEFNPSTSDPFMFVGQTGLIAKPTEKMDAKAVFTYTGYSNIKNGFSGGNANNTNGTNAVQTGATALKYDYSAPMGSLEVGFNDPFGELLPIYIPRVGFFGEYTMNPSPEDKNVAWMAGTYIGNSKVSGWKTWKATTAYKYLAKDAWLDIFPDSDFYGGATGAKGVETVLELGLAKNMSMAIDYYQARRIGSTVAKAPEHIIQYDFNWKF